MRIGIDARLWNETGVGRYVRNLVSNLQILDRNNEYVLFVRSKDYESIKVNKWKVVTTDIRWHTIEEQLNFPRVLYKENLDLVHFPYFSVPIFYNRPFVVTIHDLIINHYPTGQASTLPLPLYKVKHFGYTYVISQAAKKAQKIITVSNATQQEITKYLKVPEEKVIVTYEGVDEKINAKFSMQNAKLQFKNQKYFLYVGNAYPHKNLERLIEAFRKVIEQNNTIKLTLVGKDDYFYTHVKEKIMELQLLDSVIILHDVSDEELANLYKHAAALVMPSLMEGFGLPALEAMSARCLVLASDIPSLREICENAAVYFDPRNVQEITDRMKQVLDNEKSFETYKENGLERVKQFSWKEMAQQTLAVYESSISL